MDKIGVVRDHRWIRADEQAARLAPRCRVVVSLGGGKVKQVDRNALVKLARPGTVIELCHAFLLAEPRRKRLSGGMRKDFRAALAALEKRGAQVFDLDTGIGSDRRKALLAVVDIDIGRSNRGKHSALNGAKSTKGRKPKDFTAQQLRDAKAVWRNVKDYPAWEDVALEFERSVPGFTTARAHRLWGGRPRLRTTPNYFSNGGPTLAGWTACWRGNEVRALMRDGWIIARDGSKWIVVAPNGGTLLTVRNTRRQFKYADSAARAIALYQDLLGR